MPCSSVWPRGVTAGSPTSTRRTATEDRGTRSSDSRVRLAGTNQLAIYVGRSRAETEQPMRHWLQTEWDVAAWSESTIDHAIRGNVDECIEQLRAPSPRASTGSSL